MSNDKGLVFYEKTHRYKIDGQWVPGVTTLIGGGLPKDALKYWAAKFVAEYVADNEATVDQLRAMGRGPMVQALKETPFQKRDDAADRGSAVHAAAEAYLHAEPGEEVEFPEEVAGYVAAVRMFIEDWRPTPIAIERPVAHRAHWWAGTADLFAEVPDGRVILFDYKTSDSGIWAETAFQCAAYSHAEFYVDADGEEVPLPKVDACYAVWLQPHEYQVFPLNAGDDVYKEFRHIAFVANAAKRAKGSRTEMGYVGLPIEAPEWEKSA